MYISGRRCKKPRIEKSNIHFGFDLQKQLLLATFLSHVIIHSYYLSMYIYFTRVGYGNVNVNPWCVCEKPSLP